MPLYALWNFGFLAFLATAHLNWATGPPGVHPGGLLFCAKTTAVSAADNTGCAGPICPRWPPDSVSRFGPKPAGPLRQSAAP